MFDIQPHRHSFAGQGSWPFWRKIQAHADSIENGRAEIEQGDAVERRIGDVIALVQDIFGSGENLQVAREISPDLQVHAIGATQGIAVLVVVKLIADEAALQAQQQAGRIPVTGFPREHILRNLGDSISQQRDFARWDSVVDYFRARELVAGGDLEVESEMDRAVEFDPAGANAPHILFLPQNG